MTEESNSNNQEKIAEIQKLNGEIQKMQSRTRLYFYIEIVVVVILVTTLVYLLLAP